MVKPANVFSLIFLLCLFTIAPAQAAQEGPGQRGVPLAGAESRLALVIGNSAYGSGPLRNPVSDARAVAGKLEGLGFQVILGLDLTQKEMKRAIWSFGDKLQAEGVGLFFYAGHGVQVSGLNYLVPLEARIRSERDMELEAVDIRYVLAEMERVRTRLNIVILDACRDNPFTRSFRSGKQGLASMNAPQGTVIAYATAPDQTAADGLGEHSPFTAALMEHLDQAGLALWQVFNRVGMSVTQRTNGRQRPWIASNFYGEFSFLAQAGEEEQTQAAPPAQEQVPDTQEAEKASREKLVAGLLRRAQAHLAADRLTTPQGVNALEAYREALRLDPGNERAGEGLKRIVGRYVAMAQEQARRGNAARARLFLDRAETVTEGDERVARLRAELEENDRIKPQARPAAREAEAPVPVIPDSDQGRLAELKRELTVIRAGIDRIKTDLEQGGEATAQTLDRLLALTNRRKELEAGIASLEKKIAQTREEREARLRTEQAARERKEREARAARVQDDIDKYNRIVSSTKDKAIHQAAWQSLTARYPEAEGLKQGDVGGLLIKAGHGKGTYTNSLGMRFAVVPAGSFMMGSPEGEGGGDEHPKHRVEITRPFLLAETEVTQAQWQAVMGGNPSKFRGPDRPVENVSWNDVQSFIRLLNKKEGTEKYRLPTEAEWEYACRAGSSGKWTFGEDVSELGDYAWHFNNSGGQTHPVGGKKPNFLGLYDIHGNVREWCQDWYGSGYYHHSSSRDPLGQVKGALRALRGGSWDFSPNVLRCAFRAGNYPDGKNGNLGLRLARDI